MSSAASAQSSTAYSNTSFALNNTSGPVSNEISNDIKTVKSSKLASQNVGESSIDDQENTDISVSVTASNLSPNYLRNVVFVINVKNNGPNNVSQMKVSFPINKTYFKWISDDSEGFYSPVTGIWTINNLTTGNRTVLHVVEQVMTYDRTVTTNASYFEGSFIDTNPDNNFSKLNLIISPILLCSKLPSV